MLGDATAHNSQENGETKIKAKPRIERNRVLVTGGAGFVGSHLCTYLVERGDHVSSVPPSDASWHPAPAAALNPPEPQRLTAFALTVQGSDHQSRV